MSATPKIFEEAATGAGAELLDEGLGDQNDNGKDLVSFGLWHEAPDCPACGWCIEDDEFESIRIIESPRLCILMIRVAVLS